MSVYVDEPIKHSDGQWWCHMIADTHDELMVMAESIGLKPEWIQDAGTYREHFDLVRSKRSLAIMNGALPQTFGQLGRILNAKKRAS